MEVITGIKRERGRIRVTVNESEDVLVPLPLFRERPLQEGQPLDLAEYDNWLMVRQYRAALDRAVGYLAARARSRHEIEQKLLQAGYRPCTVEMVLYKLARENLLDDADFARQWVESRLHHKMGRSRIAQELRRKGVSQEDAEEALSAIDEEDQLSGAIALAEKAAARIKPGEDVRKARSRISAMLARRGYGWDIAKEAVEQAMAVVSEDDT
ncbi:MAG: regulatory protein RecX [Clostridiales bacterium]|nr:regulatory protein RecX [Clostridiales bacterium]